MPRFRILIHDHPRLHWDLLLESVAALTTWRLLKEPSTPGDIPAEALPDHRQIYLEYSGPVSGGRGTVTEWDRGTFEFVSRTDRSWLIRLQGRRLQGLFELNQTESAGSTDPSRWTFRPAPGEPLTGGHEIDRPGTP